MQSIAVSSIYKREMNAAKVAVNGEDNEGHNEDLANNTNHNDCGKLCGIVVGGGARPKVRNMVSNIPNGIGSHTNDDTAKVNNNVMIAEELDSAVASTSTACVGINRVRIANNVNVSNGLDTRHHKDSYLQNNVNNQAAIDKCPLKVRTCPGENDSAEDSALVNDHCKFKSAARSWHDWDDTSSDTGNEGEEGLSADECCIYTYKGDQMADLPSSFFRLDALAHGLDGASSSEGTRREEAGDEQETGHNDGNSSPEMDFLEMDFDPGPSCEQDSEEDSDHCDTENEEPAVVFSGRSEEEKPPETSNKFNGGLYNLNNLSAAGSSRDNIVNTVDSSSSTPEEILPNPSVPPVCLLQHSVSVDAVNLGAGSSLNHTSRNPVCRSARDIRGCHSYNGDVGPLEPTPFTYSSGPVDNVVLWDAGVMKIQKEGGMTEIRRFDLNNAMCHLSTCSRYTDKQSSFPDEEELHNDEAKENLFQRGRALRERVMIWSEAEAFVKEVPQISTSACGATAVINALTAFNIPFHIDNVKSSVNTRLRAETAPLPEYLFSRSVAGATHVDIIRGLEVASNGILYGRFFHLYPDRNISLSCWLAYWMRKGAIPILTLNLQQCHSMEHPVPDAWHHQMVFGVSPYGINLTNPIDCSPETVIWPQLCSPSVLLVRRSDVLSRWTSETNLRPLTMHSDPRWKKMNVLGQVVNMIRETQCSRLLQTQGWVVTQHIAIPASYSSGVTLAIRRDSPGFEELQNASDLPLLRH